MRHEVLCGKRPYPSHKFNASRGINEGMRQRRHRRVVVDLRVSSAARWRTAAYDQTRKPHSLI